ncbi:FAD dependent sulfhydryl oxidase Erv2 [Macrophomina phaseolina]|uniref:Sulfhydryl oxidase n=1 Tax=Macrophomina phaseolina TaxID=35725 RepID=A0ABQ8GTS2_9PEZI|nr:FAD dependent sulfhydryl oxidase Erv2 [Macrophomina phaseolina]
MPLGPTRRLVLLLILGAGLVSVLYISSFRPQITGHPGGVVNHAQAPHDIGSATLTGPAIAPKLGNETAKAELGNAAWKLLHTTFARFPDSPTPDEQAALRSYIHLFQRLYPCGECAQHFATVLEKFPPQVSSRSAAAAWGCHVHNEVNKRLHKEIFDCSNIGDFYDCGCADTEEDEKTSKKDDKAGKKDSTVSAHDKPEMPAERVEKLSGDNGREVDLVGILNGEKPLELEKEGWTNGG